MAIVVGRLAAQTPSFFRVFSSILEATIKGGAHCKNSSYQYLSSVMNKESEIFLQQNKLFLQDL